MRSPEDATPPGEHAEKDASTMSEQLDSENFSRCSSCVHAEEIDKQAGTLHCKHHDMYINAEADEIPDDCIAYMEASRKNE